MKTFWKLIIQNLSHIFSIIGIALSLYFGVYYVPDWLEENQKEKVLNAQKDLEQSVKELIFADTICSYNEIKVLINAKEIEVKESTPFEPMQVLIKVQESFMQDRFLPLIKRKDLMAEIEIIKKEIPKFNRTKKVEKSNKSSILGYISIFFTLVSVFIGIVSYYTRFIREKEKDEEIANQINQTENIDIEVDSAQSYEKKIKNVIKNIPGAIVKETNFKSDLIFDIIFEFHGETYFVECKYLIRTKVGLSSFERFVSQLQGLDGNFLFVYNTDLTNMVRSRVNELEKFFFINNIRKVFLIKAASEEEFKLQLKKLLKIEF